jgi:RecJ-like exonuclease
MTRYCPDCASSGGFFKGNGICGLCDGTGTTPQLNPARPKCSMCGGAGVCVTCHGRGRVKFADYAALEQSTDALPSELCP